MRNISILLENTKIDITSDLLSSLRLNLIVSKAENPAIKGGTFSSSLTLPKTKNNNRFFLSKNVLGGVNKFNALDLYSAKILIDGISILSGSFRLNRITKDGYIGEFSSSSSDWISLLEDSLLNQIGYVDGEPTWFFPFEGATTIQTANNAPVGSSILTFPTIVYNNTPLADYFTNTRWEVFGYFDGSGNQTTPPLDFPNAFLLQNAYFGWRDGLTFEDFPPAIHYASLIRKCFESIGWNVTGEIFNLDWFNALYMAYTGPGYKYNYKTLGFFETDCVEHLESAISVPFFANYENFSKTSIGLPNILYVESHCPNIGYWDDITTRVDKIANFNKFLVTDESSGTLKGGGYVCPATGRYKIRVKSFYFKELIPDGASGAADIDSFGNSLSDFGWDDNVLLITRRNQAGDLVFSYSDISLGSEGQDFRNTVMQWIGGINSKFVTEPSDVIAYASPKRIAALGSSNINSTGSPLSNFSESVNVISSSHNIINNTTLIKSVESSAEIEIEIDLQKNERINFYWISYINGFGGSFNSVDNSNTQLNNLISEIEINYVCGYDDIDIASNLPEISCKEFISSFINQFNLFFDVSEGSNTLEFIFSKNFQRPASEIIDISDRIDVDSIEIFPCPIPSSLIVGYENDSNDRFLTENIDSCDFSTSKQVLSYANINISNNPNAYSDGVLRIQSMFSSTKFTSGVFDLHDITSSGITIGSLSDTFPGSTNTITSYWKYTDGASLSFAVPSIQSQSSFEQVHLSDLEYFYSYKPRIFYFLGTAANHFGSDPNLRIKIDSRGPVLGTEDFNIEPTVCAFDAENNNPYPTLRYDGINGLYAQYFDNIVALGNASYCISCEAALRIKDWNLLKNRIVKIFDNLYRLNEIENWDPLQQEKAKIILTKIF